jgi:ankyrin repeat protein
MSEQFEAAICSGQLEEVRRLLQSGSDPNAIFDDVRALYYAILEGHIPIVRLLLASGAVPNFVADERLAGRGSAARCEAWLRLAVAVANHFGALPRFGLSPWFCSATLRG